MGLFRRKDTNRLFDWRVIIETTCPSGYGKKQEKAMQKIFPAGVGVENVELKSSGDVDLVTFTIDCKDSRRFSKLTKRIYGWPKIASMVLGNKLAHKMLLKLADDPKDVETVKDMVNNGTNMRVVKKNELE